jgi:hypothetical protein
MSELLEQVAAAAKAKRDLERTLEARLREEMKRQLAEADTALAVAAGQAFRAGTAKAAIGRALGSKDYNTYNDYITRGFDLTAGVESDTSATGASFSIDDEYVVTVSYDGQVADFTTMSDDEGLLYARAITPLWNEDYSVRNEVVNKLDLAYDGELYEEFIAFVNSKGIYS